jgi:hypothetical protein
MSIPPGPAAPAIGATTTAAQRRWRVGVMTLVLVLAATVSLVIVNLLAARMPVRWDVTLTGEHRLSPRTGAVLARVKERHEIVVAGPLSDRASIDPQARQRTQDVIAQLASSSRGLVTSTTIDTGSAEGLRKYQDLLTRLAGREADKAARQSEAVASAAATAVRLADQLEALSPRLQAVGAAVTPDSPSAGANKAYFEQRAAESRLSARGLRDISASVQKILQARLDPLPIPDTEQASALLRPALGDLQTGLASIVENIRKFAASESIPAPARDAARPLVEDIAKLRDETALARDALERLPRLDLLRIAGALRSGNAVLVIGPPAEGITALEFAALFPPPATGGGGSRADYARSSEELLTTALGTLVNPARPIVVLLHAQTRAAMEKLPIFDAISERLAMRGIDLLLWPVVESSEPPSTARLDPSGARPVVYVCFNTAGFAGGKPGETGQERVAKLAKALDSLIDAGKSVLMSIMPSTAPSYGEKDATTAFLAQFGLEADSGRPILKERITPEGRRVEAFQILQPGPGDHPILAAVRGLPTRFEWPIPLHPISPAPDRTTVTPLYTVDDPNSWAESQWLGLFQVPMSQHASVPNPPANDSSHDDSKGPWIVAAAAERTLPGLDHPQRLVVVGSNSWFADPILREPMQIEGRVVAANPGNGELFEASVMWLARQDDLIAQSATARAAPIIVPLSQTTLLLLKLAASVGLPVLVLAAGAAYRVWRG